MRCQKLLNFFSVLEIFFANFDPSEVKKLLNSLTMSCGFSIMVLLTLISWEEDLILFF